MAIPSIHKEPLTLIAHHYEIWILSHRSLTWQHFLVLVLQLLPGHQTL